MRVYLERGDHRAGAISAADEEECFTALGRRTGVFLTSEPLTGPQVLSADVDAEVVLAFDVSGDDREHRVYVVPAEVCSAWAFA